MENPGIHEKVEGFWVNLRGYPTISIQLNLKHIKCWKVYKEMGKILDTVRENYDFSEDIEQLLKPLLHSFDVTYMNKYKIGKSKWLYFFLKPERYMKDSFGFDRELLCAFFEYTDLHSRNFEQINEILMENRVRLDQMVCIFISNVKNADEKVKEFSLQDPERICFIPFSKSFLIKNKPDSVALRNHFQEHLFKRDLFAIESPIRTDRYFFGREDLVIQFIDRIKNGQNTGIFGLRKIGKTSLIYAIKRNINSKKIGSFVYYDCSNPGFYKSQWGKCLKILLKEILLQTDLYEKIDINIDDQTIESIPQFFYDSVMEILDNVPENRLTIGLDEIEWISFKTSPEDNWNKDFLPFWQLMRSIHQTSHGKFTFIISGVNPKCVEDESIGGYDNPLFALIKPFFLKPFDEKSVRTMLRMLGKYMGIKFESDFYSLLIKTYGGHPFLVRHACSKLCELITERPIEFTQEHFYLHKKQINLSLQKNVKQILNILSVWYPSEYEMVVYLSKGKVDIVENYLKEQPEFLEHLLGYGLVTLVNNKPELSLLILSTHLKKEKQKDNIEISSPIKVDDYEIEEIRSEISRKRNRIEEWLRDLIRAGLRFKYGNKCMSILLSSLFDDRKKILCRFGYESVFKELYFNELITILLKNWDVFQNWFSRDLKDVELWLKTINEFRIDAHAKEIDAENLAFLRICFNNVEKSLSGSGELGKPNLKDKTSIRHDAPDRT